MKLLALGAIVGLAFAVEAAAGFGATVVTVTLAARFMPVEQILVALLPVNLLMSITIVARHRSDVAWRTLLARILPWMLGGLGAGVVIASRAPSEGLKTAFALLVMALSVVELGRSVRGAGAGDARWGPVALLGGGVVHGIYACGGPLVVYFASRELPEKARFRATLSALWMVLNAVLLVRYALGSRLSAASLETSALLVAPVIVGMVVGERAHARVSEKAFSRGVYVLLFFAGLALATA